MENSTMKIFSGVDIGHQAIKVVLVDQEAKANIVGTYYEVTGSDAYTGTDHALAGALEVAGHTLGEVSYMVITGAGRKEFGTDAKSVSSARCIASGARYFLPKARTVIDMGAEGFSVVSLDDLGVVTKCKENDKCASGSGIFLEEMARAMQVGVEEACQLAIQAQRREAITSLCTVFAESEVISAVHRGVPKGEILAGIHEALAKRIATAVRATRPKADVVVTGGVARNPCLIKMLGENLDLPLHSVSEPHLVTALGAALIARQYFMKQQS
jgi:predicted CoA-substrate-specific enzyme activase